MPCPVGPRGRARLTEIAEVRERGVYGRVKMRARVFGQACRIRVVTQNLPLLHTYSGRQKTKKKRRPGAATREPRSGGPARAHARRGRSHTAPLPLKSNLHYLRVTTNCGPHIEKTCQHCDVFSDEIVFSTGSHFAHAVSCSRRPQSPARILQSRAAIRTLPRRVPCGDAHLRTTACVAAFFGAAARCAHVALRSTL